MSDMFFIHIADPGFPDPPWPGQRRLGPFDTADEALAQATADTAQGAGGSPVIYSSSDSDLLAAFEAANPAAPVDLSLPAAPDSSPTPTYDADTIAAAGAAAAQTMQDARVADLNAQVAVLTAILPPTLSDSDAHELLSPPVHS